VTDLVLGLDVGTTAVKAAVFDADGTEVATGRAPTPWRTVPTGAEIDADELLAAAVAAAREAVAAAAGRIVAIGVASVAETGVLLDKDGRPVVPGIAWHDERGSEQAERLANDLPEFSARVGLPPTPLCSLAKYRWLREHVPGSERGVRWLNVAEWIVAGLGGAPISELSLSSRTGFFDLHTKQPYAEALDWAEAPSGLVGEVVPAGTPMGISSLPEARGAVLTVGGHDHLSAAVGAGAAGDGDVLNSCGTAEAFVRASAALPPDRVARAVASDVSVGWHAADGRQCLLGAQWSGAFLRDVLARLGVEPEDRAPIEKAALELENAGPPARTLGGLDDLDALEGLAPAAAYHAALDAVARGGAAILERMAAVAGPAKRLIATGGWAAGPAARAVKQRHLGPFELSPALATGAARGAAVAAAHAASLQEVM
jgi:sugar (pentulose or hexulose) kinase